MGTINLSITPLFIHLIRRQQYKRSMMTQTKSPHSIVQRCNNVLAHLYLALNVVHSCKRMCERHECAAFVACVVHQVCMCECVCAQTRVLYSQLYYTLPATHTSTQTHAHYNTAFQTERTTMRTCAMSPTPQREMVEWLGKCRNMTHYSR